jgi:hypothetical protein
MTIVLTNAAEAGMPADMIGHCRQLIAWRIEQKFDGLPKPGDDVTILYSEKDPLMETDLVDDRAYMIYFTVSRVEEGGSGQREDATVYVDLAV